MQLLNAVASICAQEWLREQAAPEWFDRYSTRIEESRLPKGKEARKRCMPSRSVQTVLGCFLPSTIHQISALPMGASCRPERCDKRGYFNTMQRMGTYCWRKAEDLPPAGLRILIRPMIQKRVLAINARLPGQDTKFISRKRVKMRRSISLPMWKRLPPGLPIVSFPLPFMML